MRRCSRSTFPLPPCPARRTSPPCGGRSRSSPGPDRGAGVVRAAEGFLPAGARPHAPSARRRIVAAVRLIDLRTKLLVVEKDDPGLGSVLEAAARALSRDVREAGRGGVPPGEAVRPVADNTNAEGGASFTDVSGGSVVVRAGTDQLGLRGVMRTPLLAVRLSRGAGAGGGGESRADRIRVDASSVWLRAGPLSASEGPGRADEPRAEPH